MSKFHSQNNSNEFIIEVRYKANPKILDYRGTWSEIISRDMDLDQWNIIENRFDIFNKEKSRRVFVSYKNSGFVVQNTPSRNYFQDNSNKLFRFLLNQEPFGKTLTVNRLGIRSRFAIEFDGSFSDLLEIHTNKFISPNFNPHILFKGNIIDAGIPLNIKSNLGNINSMCGPMDKDQTKQNFPFDDSLSVISYYLDIDYWLKPRSEVDYKYLSLKIKQICTELWRIYDDFLKYLDD